MKQLSHLSHVCIRGGFEELEDFEELQTVLFEVELIINNAPLT